MSIVIPKMVRPCIQVPSVKSGIGVPPLLNNYIFNLFNGVDLPKGVTFTGGAQLIQDEDGIVQSTPLDTLAVEGGYFATTIADGATLGSELITNSDDRDFSSDTGWWSRVNATISDGVCTISGGYLSRIDKLGTIAGKRYQITFTVNSISSGTLEVYKGYGVFDSTSITTPGTYTIEFTATSTIFGIGTDSSVTNAIIDNVSFKEVVPFWKAATGATYTNVKTRSGIIPVYDFDDSFKGYLPEPAATNLFLQSKFLDNAAWLQNTYTLTGSSGVAPDGSSSAYSIEGGSLYFRNATPITVLQSTTYTLSFWAKNDATNPAEAANWAAYDVTNGSTIVADTSYLSQVTTSWKRLQFSFTTPDTCTQVYVYPMKGAAIGTGKKMYLWNPQFEKGDAATSDIRTTTATVTRTATAFIGDTDKWGIKNQNMCIFAQVRPNSIPVTSQSLYRNQVTANDHVRVWFTDRFFIKKEIDGTAYQTVQSQAYSLGDTVQIIAMYTDKGIALCTRLYSGGSWHSWESWKEVSNGDPVLLSSEFDLTTYTVNYQKFIISQLPEKSSLSDYENWALTYFTSQGII